MDQSEAITVIEKALARIPSLRASHGQSPQHVAFVQTTGMDLARVFGADSPVSMNFSRIAYQATGALLISPLFYDIELSRKNHEGYLQGLNVAEGILFSALEQLQSYGIDKILRRSTIRNEGARIFISHGTEGPALTKLERFLRALGTQPVVVMREASEGMSVDDLVEKRLSESDCVIILATADDQIGERRQPRPNVIHEIGLAQERFPGNVIYLKEQGCEFPSNVKPKVWGDFVQENMEGAFEKVSKELNAMGLL